MIVLQENLLHMIFNPKPDYEKPHLIRVQRSEVFDTMKVVELEIKHEKGTASGKASSPANRKKLAKKRKEEDLHNSHQW